MEDDLISYLSMTERQTHQAALNRMYSRALVSMTEKVQSDLDAEREAWDEHFADPQWTEEQIEAMKNLTR